MTLFDKVSLTLIIGLIIISFILMMFDISSNHLSKWIAGGLITTLLVGLVWLIHALWF